MKKVFIVANWKCNPATIKKAMALFSLNQNGVKNVKDKEVILCVPFIYIASIIQYNNTKIEIGAQNCSGFDGGAYTGEISVPMLKDLGCKYVIIGHSERRKNQKETDKEIAKKVEAVLNQKMTPILCVDKINQLTSHNKGTFVAYEPLFAIGTGKACSSKFAKQMLNKIKEKIGESIVLYGGSVDSKNVKEYIDAGFDGVLVGGASLKPKEFIELVKTA